MCNEKKTWEVADVEAVLTGGSFKESMGTACVHRQCVHAVKEALLKAGPFLLEPIMATEIFVPDAFVGGEEKTNLLIPKAEYRK